MMSDYTIDPRVYELFLKLTPKQRSEFLEDLLKIYQGESNE
jgi:hypothetical protein